MFFTVKSQLMTEQGVTIGEDNNEEVGDDVETYNNVSSDKAYKYTAIDFTPTEWFKWFGKYLKKVNKQVMVKTPDFADFPRRKTWRPSSLRTSEATSTWMRTISTSRPLST